VIRVPDRVDLVLVGAEALGADPDEVLDGADMGLLVLIESRLRGARSVAGAAAAALVAVAAGRPFPDGNRAAAWLAAALVAALNDRRLVMEVDGALALVGAAEAGTLDEAAVAAEIERALAGPARRRSAVAAAARRIVALARTPEPASPPERSCPVCRRPVDADVLWLGAPWAVVPPDQLVSGCARRHGAHDRHGRSVAPTRRAATPTPAPGDRLPLIAGPGPAFVALTDGGPVLLRAAEPDRSVTYDLFTLDDLPLSALVGDWGDLTAGRSPVARVVVDDEPIDPRAPALDWRDVRALATTGTPR
jgi:hypothetical protein